jgi:L-cysteine:1D-myo-inositol 2-amino-2-deoxy-alpha-D-glucopyranoside ligase
VSALLKVHDPGAIRLAIYANHYRSSWAYDDQLLRGAEERLARWQAAGRGSGALGAVRARLDDDLDTPGALAAIDEASAAGEGVDEAASLLGVGLG